MQDILLKIVPVFVTFFLGYLLKKTKSLKEEDGGLLLKLVFFVGAPALTFTSINSLQFSKGIMTLPLIAILMIFSTYFISLFFVRKSKVARSTKGVFLVATMIMNTGFVLPFILANYGQEGIARLAMFDFMNGLLTFTFIYLIAVFYGDKKPDKKFVIQKMLISPPLWALFLGFFTNIINWTPPFILDSFLKTLGGLTSPLIMLALGLYYTPKLIYPKLITLGVLVRFLVGGILGLIFTNFLGLTGVDRATAIIFSCAPFGFNTLTFSNMENLDTKFATSLVSIGIIFGLIVTPLIIIFV